MHATLTLGTVVAAVLVLAAPLGAAAAHWPDPIVVRDPRWPADDPHYYLRVEFFDPELPRDGEAKDDCAAGAHPRGAVGSLARLVEPIRSNPPDPSTFNGLSPYTPTCVAVDSGMGVYASWNVANGYWYVDGAGTVLPIGPQSESSDGALAGRLLVGVTADCADCPTTV